ncbi:MAG: GAF domain-containing protein, partial [SAR202 cluster bacterium]|nr:GAF domain-containing protein [SAR202 cluster bacterium]
MELRTAELKQREEESRRLANENAVMAEIGRIISLSLDLEQVYERFAHEVAKLVSFDRIAIIRVNRQRTVYQLAHQAGVDVPGRRRHDFVPLEGSFTKLIIENPQGIIYNLADAPPESLFPGAIPVYDTGIKSSLGVPLVANDDVPGVLILDSRASGAFTERSLETVRRVAAQISGAVANTQLHAALSRAAQERESLAVIGRIIGSSLDIGQQYGKFAEELGKLMAYDRITIGLIDADQDTWTVAYTQGIEVSDRDVGYVSSLAGSFADRVIRSRDGISGEFGTEEDNRNRVTREPAGQAGIRSYVGVPLISNDQAIGVLYIGSTAERAYDDHDLELAFQVGLQISGAVANSRLYTEGVEAEQALQRSYDELEHRVQERTQELHQSEEQARDLARENAAIAEIGRIISSSLDITEVFDDFAQRVAELMPADRIVLSAIAPGDEITVVNLCVWGQVLSGWEQGASRAPRGGFTPRAMRSRRSVIVSQEEIHRSNPATTEAGLRSLLVVPLISENEPVGVLHFRTSLEEAYNQRHVTFAESVATQVAGAVASSQLHAELSREAVEREALVEISRIVGSSLDTDGIFERFAHEVARVLPFDRLTVSRADSKTGIGVQLYVTGVDIPSGRAGTTLALKGSLVEAVVQSRSGLIAGPDDWHDLQAKHPGLGPGQEFGLVSSLIVPLIARDEVLGTLNIRSKQVNAYADRDLDLAQRVAAHLSSSIANSELYIEQLETEEALRNSESQALNLANRSAALAEISRIIGSSLKIEEVFDKFAQAVRQFVPNERMTISTVLPEDGDKVINMCVSGLEIPYLAVGKVRQSNEGLTQTALTLRQTLIGGEDTTNPLNAAAVSAGLKSLMVVPLVSNGQPIGALHIRTSQKNAYTDQHISFAESVAAQVADAVASSRLHAEISRESEEREALGEIGRIVGSTLDISEVYQR